MAYITRLKQLSDAIDTSPANCIILSERCIYTDREIFAKMLFDSGKIEEINYSIYLKWFDFFIKDIKLSGIIYIKTSPEVCYQRVIKRSRKGEGIIPLEYLTSCHEYHEKWLTNKEFNVLTILDNNSDIVEFIKSVIR